MDKLARSKHQEGVRFVREFGLYCESMLRGVRTITVPSHNVLLSESVFVSFR